MGQNALRRSGREQGKQAQILLVFFQCRVMQPGGHDADPVCATDQRNADEIIPVQGACELLIDQRGRIGLQRFERTLHGLFQ